MEEVSLYIHVPFCSKKCMYCDFPSFCGKDSLMEDYVRALSKEIFKVTEGKLISTIFIGGGTPTYLSLESWKVIGEVISKLNIKKSLEFSVECNPGTVTIEKLNYLKEIGVNRLSIGLQAWQDHLLRGIGRIHNAEEFLKCYEMARLCGFKNINIDVMFGLPNQTVADIEDTLDKVINLKPEHISCYSLIIEEGTPFFNLHEKGDLDLPNEDKEREMSSAAVGILEGNGYKRYEISNFAAQGYECRHNLVYWELKNYIGCGSAAHSYLNSVRYRNETNIEEYIRAINKSGSAVVEEIMNSTKDNIEEFMFMGLRKINGINEEEFQLRFQKDIDVVYEKVINKHIGTGLLKRKSGRIYLTKKGIELSNFVMSDFLL